MELSRSTVYKSVRVDKPKVQKSLCRALNVIRRQAQTVEIRCKQESLFEKLIEQKFEKLPQHLRIGLC
jgi:hypothetical protein